MPNLIPVKIHYSSRLAGLCLLLAIVVLLSGCSSLLGIKKPVKVHPLLTPLSAAKPDQLISEINRLASVRSIRGKTDIQFQDTSFAESGLAEKYRTADGTVILQRPGNIFLTIQVPFFNTDVAQMTSDGSKFRVAVLQGDAKYKRFVMGTNSASYNKLQMGDSDKSPSDDRKSAQAERTVSTLSSLRPQHFTEALLMKPVETKQQSGFLYAQSETYEDEPDTRPRAGKNDRVVRSYYLLDELAPANDGIAKVVRRFWFDRVGGIRLARMQNYDETGALTTDVVYGDLKSFGEQGIRLPSRVEITRPQDRYKISITYQAPDAVVLDHEYPADVFVLENKWGLPEVNLDERGKDRVPNKQ
jgi:hypothetical protein